MEDNTTEEVYVYRVGEYETLQLYIETEYPHVMKELKDIVEWRTNHIMRHVCISDEALAFSYLNGSEWRGTMGLIQRNEADCQSILTPVDYEASKLVDYSFHSLSSELVFLTKIKEQKVLSDILESYLSAEWHVWFLVAGVLLVLLVLQKLPKVLATYGNEHLEPAWNISYFSAFIALLLYQGRPRLYKGNAFRSLLAFYLFYVQVLAICLFAFLKTDLVMTQTDKITCVRDFFEKPHFKPLLVDHGTLTKIFMTTPDGDYKRLWELLNEDKNRLCYAATMLGDAEFISKYLRMVSSGEYVLIGAPSVVKPFAMYLFKGMHFYEEREVISGSLMAFPIRKSLERKKKDFIFYRLRLYNNGDIFHYLFRSLENEIPEMFVTGSKDVGAVSEIKNLGIQIFIKTSSLFGIGLGFAFVVFICEFLVLMKGITKLIRQLYLTKPNHAL